MLDDFVVEPKMRVEMKSNRNMLRNFYFWFTD